MRIGRAAVATLLAALPGLPLATLAARLAAPRSDPALAGGFALATLPLLAVAAAWAVGRVPPAAPRIAASCGAAPGRVIGRVWLALIWPALAAGVAGGALAAAAVARLRPAIGWSVLAWPLAAAGLIAAGLAAHRRLPHAAWRAAASAGAAPPTLLRRLVLPAIAPLLLTGVIAGAALATAWLLARPDSAASG